MHPQAPLIWAAHAALAFAGSLLAVAEPVAGFSLVLLAATSLYLDLNARMFLLRSLFFRRASQNVVSPGGRPDAPGTLVLLAHYDAARGGALFAPNRIVSLPRLGRLLPFSPARALFWSMALLVPLTGARMAGLESDAIALAQVPPTLALLVSVYLLVDLQLSPVTPGANDNASGVALALGLAERLRNEPPANLDVWLVLTGGHECGNQGVRAFLRSHRKELDRASTHVVVLDAVGGGDVRWLSSEGLAVSFEMDPRLIELCEIVAVADRDEEGDHGAEPLRHGLASDALAARVHRWRAVTLTCREPGSPGPAHHHTNADSPDAIDAAALDRAERFALGLVQAIDRDAGRRAS